MEHTPQPDSVDGLGSRAFIGLDIGNTRLTACVAAPDGELLFSDEQPAPSAEGAPAAVPLLLEMARAACAAARERLLEPAGLGLGFGGPVDYRRQVTRGSFHSPGWDDLPLGEVFGRHIGLPTLLDNDANAGGLAEALFGAAKGYATSLYVNVGTGIGGAVVIDAAVHHGATGCAGEIGHVTIDPEGPLCNCGKRGCLEAVASGTGMARAAAAAGRGELSGRDVMRAAENGDEVCVEIVRRSAAALGMAIANAVNVLDPDIVVLGGGVPETGRMWLTPLWESFTDHAVASAAGTRLVPAALGYHAGVLGAAALAIQAFRAEGEAQKG